MGIQPLGHTAHHDVAIGDHADQPPVLDHGQAADVLIAHHAGCQSQPHVGPDDRDLPLHHAFDEHRPLLSI
jgi:hypothetical protein